MTLFALAVLLFGLVSTAVARLLTADELPVADVSATVERLGIVLADSRIVQSLPGGRYRLAHEPDRTGQHC